VCWAEDALCVLEAGQGNAAQDSNNAISTVYGTSLREDATATSCCAGVANKLAVCEGSRTAMTADSLSCLSKRSEPNQKSI
jgi:hypothetical protein